MAAQKYPPILATEPPLQGQDATVIRWARQVVQGVNALLGGAVAANLGGQAAGQCYFALASATVATLYPCNGNQIFIGGQFYTIPAAGVSVSSAPYVTAAGTTYNVYAYALNGAIALELSGVGRATDPTYGHQIKSGDPSRTLVGKVWVNATGFDTTNGGLCISWFNQKHRVATTTSPPSSSPAVSTAAAPTMCGLNYFSPRAYFLSWGESSHRVYQSSVVYGGSVNIVYFTQTLIINDANSAQGGTINYFQPYANNAYGTMIGEWKNFLGENLGAGGSGNAYYASDFYVWSNSAGAVLTFVQGETLMSVENFG